jgi:hypothetical protein
MFFEKNKDSNQARFEADSSRFEDKYPIFEGI